MKKFFILLLLAFFSLNLMAKNGGPTKEQEKKIISELKNGYIYSETLIICYNDDCDKESLKISKKEIKKINMTHKELKNLLYSDTSEYKKYTENQLAYLFFVALFLEI